MAFRKKKKEKKKKEPWTWKLIKLAGAGEDNDTNICITQNWQLLSLFQQPITPLWEGHLPAVQVLNFLDLNFASPHFVVAASF